MKRPPLTRLFLTQADRMTSLNADSIKFSDLPIQLHKHYHDKMQLHLSSCDKLKMH